MGIKRTQYLNNQFAPKRVDNAYITMSANQTADIANGDPIKFDTLDSGNISFDAVTYRATLKANKKYYMEALVLADFSADAAYVTTQLYDVTNAAYVGKQAFLPSVTNTTVKYSGTGIDTYQVTPSVDTVYEVRIINPANLNRFQNGYSYWKIVEVESFVQPNTYPFLVNAQQYDLTVTGANWTTTRAVGVPYKTTDGTWKLWFSITGTRSSGSAITAFTLTVAGVVFEATASNYQPVACSANNLFSDGDIGHGYVNPNTGEILINFDSNNPLALRCSNTVELKEKPDFI